jgi:hypothetical protein
MQDERMLDKYLIAKVAHYRKQDSVNNCAVPEWRKISNVDRDLVQVEIQKNFKIRVSMQYSAVTSQRGS